MKSTVFNSALFLKDPEVLPIYVERKVHELENLPPVHQHEFYELVYIVYGRAEHFFEGSYYEINTGDILIIKPGENHTYLLKQGASIEIINCLFLSHLLGEEWLLAVDKKRDIHSFLEHPFLNNKEGFHHRLSLGRVDACQVLQLLENMIFEQHRKRSNLAAIIRLQLMELLFSLISSYEEWLFQDQKIHVPHNERTIIVKRVQQYMEENYEQKFVLETLSNMCHISPRHLNRLFKQDTGKTVMEMKHHIRMERAKQLLANTNDRIVDVSGKIGYEDISFFMKLFTRSVGCTPALYRKKFR